MTDARRLTRPRAQKKARRRAPDTAKSPDAFVELVRFSRAGDQFHYLWAARRILKLIDPHATLVAVAIEGVSKLEAGDFEATRAGEAVVDLTEYAGNERLEAAAEVRYVQLKHSTQRADEALGAAGLADTLRGFAQRYAAQRRAHGDPVADIAILQDRARLAMVMANGKVMVNTLGLTQELTDIPGYLMDIEHIQNANAAVPTMPTAAEVQH